MLGVVLAAFGTGVLWAGEAWIPVTAHATGVGGTVWRTDLEIRNTGEGTARVRIEALLEGQANPDPAGVEVTVGEGESLRIGDVLWSLFSVEGAAALRLTAVEGAFLASSRTYNLTAGGTYGQYVPAISGGDALGKGETGELIQLAQSEDPTTGYRTNLGLLETAGATTPVTVILRDAGGAELGRFVQDLEPGELVQIGQVFRRGRPGHVDDGHIVLETTGEGGRFLAYASVVDNRTGDAVFVPVLRRAQAVGAGTGVVADHLAADAFDTLTAVQADAARQRFARIFYGHTSHGSQIMTGLGMLEAESATWAMPQFTERSTDLGHNGDLAWVGVTRDMLGEDGNGFDMVVWSWCGGVSDNTPEGIQAYLDAMDGLERDYPGIVFVYMTGHLDGTGEDGTLRRNNDQIRSWCRQHGTVLFDFADIERWDPDGVEYPEGSDACEWCSSWCGEHACPDCGGCAHSHCFNCYRKGRAFWWLLVRTMEEER